MSLKPTYINVKTQNITYTLKGHSLCVHLCTPARKFELHNVKLRLKENRKKIEDKKKNYTENQGKFTFI